MQNKKILLSVLIGISAVGTALSSFGLTKAWFASGTAFGNQNLEASSVSNYFAGGDGSEDDPFLIKEPVHMYNLSWLQARGIFDTKKTYFKVADAEGGGPRTIDFAGELSGTTTTTGAIPPIGTDEHHFIGDFDGNWATFKNVWVSSDPNDWKEKPIDIGDADTNTHVGFFGHIDQNDENKGIVRDFYLENIEVTSHVAESFVGLIAGYSNSYTENIGVKNGKLSFKQGGSNHYMSEACLIGKKGNDAYWSDIPSDGGEGGNLKIDPTETEWGNKSNPTQFNTVSNGNTIPVPNAFDGSAYVAGTMTAQSQAISACYKYNGTITFANDANKSNPISINGSNSLLLDDNRIAFSKEFLKRYDELTKNGSNARVMETPTTAPSPNSLVDVTFEDGETIKIPKNSIWFKPRKGGTCGISFTVPNMSGDRFASIFRFKRIDANTLSTNWDEIQLRFTKKEGIIQNKTVVYYEIQITDKEVEDGYEYCIGYPINPKGDIKNTPNGRFFFLYLAGTDEHSGPAPGQALLKNLDYVYKDNGKFLPSFLDENYKPNHLMLAFDIRATTDNVEFLFNMEDIPNSTNVYYYTSGPVIVDMVTIESVGVKETTTTRFPPRQQSQ